MPRQFKDRLLPGEELNVNECLVSNSGRFRLYLHKSGKLVANAYRESGIYVYWQASPPTPPSFPPQEDRVGPHPVLKLFSRGTLTGVYPCLGVFGSAGEPVLITGHNTARREPAWKSMYFVLQDDANLVHYIANQSSGEVYASWAPDRPPVPRDALIRPHNIAPNETIIDLGPQGTLAIDAGTDDIWNNTALPVLVRDAHRIEALPANESLPVVLPPGALAISTYFYPFDNPSGFVPPPPPATGSSADAAAAGIPADPRPREVLEIPPREGRGHRRRIDVSNRWSLSLTNQFSPLKNGQWSNYKLVGVTPETANDVVSSDPDTKGEC